MTTKGRHMRETVAGVTHRLGIWGSGNYVQEVCECDHYKRAHEARDVAGGHGRCSVQGCECERFTWIGFGKYRTMRP